MLDSYMVCRVRSQSSDGTKIWKACIAHPPGFKGLPRQSANVEVEEGIWPPEINYAITFYKIHNRWPIYKDVVPKL